MASHKPLIGFVGQGYVGKNYADDFESRGYSVVRYSLEQPYIANKDLIKDCDVVFVAVPTPSTPKGFDGSIVEEALNLVGKGKVAVIKSTVVPGMTRQLQKKHPEKIVLFCPEFLSVATAAYDVANPFLNVVGISSNSKKHKVAAQLTLDILKKAPENLICTSEEAELVNAVYDLSEHFGANWSAIQRAVEADPLICNRYANPVHKGGRGAGGFCFIKDMAAFARHYEKTVKEPHGAAFLNAAQAKNIALLAASQKDLDLLHGVYGKRLVEKHSSRKRA